MIKTQWPLHGSLKTQLSAYLDNIFGHCVLLLWPKCCLDSGKLLDKWCLLAVFSMSNHIVCVNSSQKICCTRPPRRRRGRTRRSVSYSAPILISWMSSVQVSVLHVTLDHWTSCHLNGLNVRLVFQDVIRSRRCSATHRQSCFALVAQLCCVSPPEAKLGSPKVC